VTVDFSDYGVPADNVPLKAIGDDHLIAEANFVEIWFRRNADGRVNGALMVIEGEAREMVRAADGVGGVQ